MKKDSTNVFKRHHAVDIYKWYIDQQLKNNPRYYTVYDKVLSMRGVRVLMSKNFKGEENIVMTYTMFKSILDKVNKLIIKTLLKGEKIYFGNSLGYIQGSRIERNFNKKSVDFVGTKKLREESGDQEVTVYRTSDTYCRIAWKKVYTLPNTSVYEFKPCKNFRQEFHLALVADEMLQYSFTFYKRA